MARRRRAELAAYAGTSGLVAGGWFETGLLASMLLTSCREFHVEASLPTHALLLSTSPSGGTTDAGASLTAYVRAAADKEHFRTP